MNGNVRDVTVEEVKLIDPKRITAMHLDDGTVIKVDKGGNNYIQEGQNQVVSSTTTTRTKLRTVSPGQVEEGGEVIENRENYKLYASTFKRGEGEEVEQVAEGNYYCTCNNNNVCTCGQEVNSGFYCPYCSGEKPLPQERLQSKPEPKSFVAGEGINIYTTSSGTGGFTDVDESQNRKVYSEVFSTKRTRPSYGVETSTSILRNKQKVVQTSQCSCPCHQAETKCSLCGAQKALRSGPVRRVENEYLDNYKYTEVQGTCPPRKSRGGRRIERKSETNK